MFLAGVGLLAVTFKLAYEMFSVPHAQALGLQPGKEINMNATGGAAADIVIRIVVLVVMAIVGSMVANRGIGLYSGSLHPVDRHPPGSNDPRPSEPRPAAPRTGETVEPG